jgi:serine/threonine protein kinase
MKCPKCQFKNPSDTNYCGKCGAPLQKTEDTVAPTLTLQEPLKGLEKGKTIAGKYKILERLGEGGMATVYLAEQTKPLRRRVAIKIIKLGMDTKQVVARFEAERQALALMDHPNIAKVYDAGATEKGRPHFVMELVHGLPITEYCDKNKLSTNERLKLFTLVCNAVQHAHQKGLIHRDLKPSNILVAIHDEKPVPKIIDFGIAKATEQRLTERTLFTEMGQLIGTPEYMSPEQAEMTGLDIDTRTDIYSLGVILYELLVGALPFDIRELRKAGLEEIRRKIREDEPLKPSTKLSTLGDESNRTAKNRRTDIRSLAKLLRGELDWITIKTLAKNRTSRYATVSELASDINRYLKKEPVMARPPSTLYLIKKLATKHRMLLDSVVLLIVVLIGFYVLGIRGPKNSITYWKSEYSALNKRATFERSDARERNGLFFDLFDTSDFGKVTGDKITVDEILCKGVDKAMAEHMNQPSAQSNLLQILSGIAYEAELEFRSAAMSELARKARSKKNISGKDGGWTNNPSIQALILCAKGDYDGAEKYHREALRINQEKWGNEHQSVVDILGSLALLLWEKGEHDEAEMLLRDALTIQRKLSDEVNWGIISKLGTLGRWNYIKGNYEEAEKFFQEYLSNYIEDQKKSFSFISDSTLSYIITRRVKSIAAFLEERDDYDRAEKYYREAVEINRELLGEKNMRTILAEIDLGNVLIKLRRFDEAESLLIDSYKYMRGRLKTQSVNMRKAIESLVSLYETWNKPDKAEEYRALLDKE